MSDSAKVVADMALKSTHTYACMYTCRWFCWTRVVTVQQRSSGPWRMQVMGMPRFFSTRRISSSLHSRSTGNPDSVMKIPAYIPGMVRDSAHPHHLHARAVGSALVYSNRPAGSNSARRCALRVEELTDPRNQSHPLPPHTNEGRETQRFRSREDLIGLRAPESPRTGLVGVASQCSRINAVGSRQGDLVAHGDIQTGSKEYRDTLGSRKHFIKVHAI